jgi:hypothetical protein
MRQFQLRRRRAESSAGATVTSVLEALHHRLSATRRGAAAGSSVAPGAAAPDAAASDAAAPDAAAPDGGGADGGGADGGGAEPPWYVLAAPLLRYWLLGLLDPLALFGLMTAAVVRLVRVRVRVRVGVRARTS